MSFCFKVGYHGSSTGTARISYATTKETKEWGCKESRREAVRGDQISQIFRGDIPPISAIEIPKYVSEVSVEGKQSEREKSVGGRSLEQHRVKIESKSEGQEIAHCLQNQVQK